MNPKIKSKPQLEEIISLFERETKQAKTLIDFYVRNKLISSISQPFDYDRYEKKIEHYQPYLNQLYIMRGSTQFNER